MVSKKIFEFLPLAVTRKEKKKKKLRPAWTRVSLSLFRIHLGSFQRVLLPPAPGVHL